jgi:hypothetical protein
MMARYMEPTPELEQLWQQFVESRPPNVRAVASRFDPWSLYRLRASGHRVPIYAFDEEQDGRVTMRVNVLAQFNCILFERRVFGIAPDDLTPCELPTAEELTGALLDTAQAAVLIEAIRKPDTTH